ncbi:MAG: hypothetical protein ACLFST_02135 [Spirochaetia bacterium]
MNKDFTLAMSMRDMVALYLYLSDHEPFEDTRMAGIKRKVESILYQELSIEQLENLKEYYEQAII